jgi:hypothetical protein
MSFNITGGGILTNATKLTTTNATDVLAPTSRTTVLSIICTEIAGSTPTLTLALYDATTTYYLRNALAMTAKQTFIFNEPLVLNANWKLQATAGTANQIDVVVNYLNADKTAQGMWAGPSR